MASNTIDFSDVAKQDMEDEIMSMDVPELVERIEAMHKDLVELRDSTEGPVDLLARYHERLGIPPGGRVGPGGMQQRAEYVISQAQAMHQAFNSKRVYTMEEYKGVVDKLKFTNEAAYGLLRAACLVDRSCMALDRLAEGAPYDEANLHEVPGECHFSFTPAEAKLNDAQKVSIHVLNLMQDKNLRRVGDDCYKQKYVMVDGVSYGTHAWENLCTIEDFISQCVKKEVNWNLWVALTGNLTGNMKNVAASMKLNDSQFPELHKDRHVFAFRNGIYLARNGTVEEGTLSDKFVPYGPGARLPDCVVAAKYFDLDMVIPPPGTDWRNIPTPNMDKILNFQGFSQAMQEWLLVLLGRLIYNLGELDNWQVIPFLYGEAGSGKSTIVDYICTYIYEAIDVGTMSNNIEKKFGLCALATKLMFKGPEIKHDFSLEQAEFQQIVSGEEVQIHTKYKTADAVRWRAPGILAGNEVPGWADNSGSISRRIIPFHFNNSVPEAQHDSELPKKLAEEMPAIILKANRAYHAAVLRLGKASIWGHLPSEIKDQRQRIRDATNSLEHFMSCPDEVDFTQDGYVPLKAFAAAYKSHCRNNGLIQRPMTQDLYQSIFNRRGVKVLHTTLPYPRVSPISGAAGPETAGLFVKGLELVRQRGEAMDQDESGSY